MKKFNIKILSILVVMALALSSCLNDLEDFMGDFSNTPAIAELSEAANAATGTVGREIINPLVSTEFSLRVNIASTNPLNKDTKITLALDNSLIAAYNTGRNLAGAAAAIPVPLAALTIPTYEVTIPAGTREVDWTFTIDPTKVPDPVTTFYVIPVKIASSDNGVIPSGNFGTKLVRILARNEFDGKYTMKGFVMRPGDTGGLEGYFKNQAYELKTVGGNSVIMNRVQVWANGSNVGGISPWTITIDKNSAPNPIVLTDDLQGAAFIMTPGYQSRYEPSTKTFYWQVNWGTASPKNRGCTDTLVYVSPR